MKKFFALSILAVLCIASFANAMDLETLLKNANEFHDGKLAKIDDMTLEYTGTFSGPAGEGMGMTSKMIRKGDKWRMDATMTVPEGQVTMNGQAMPAGGGMETTVLFDGQHIWTSVMGMKMKMPKDQATEQLSFSQYWTEPPAGSEVTGEETVNGRDCYVVVYPKIDQTESETTIWLDKDYYVNVKSESKMGGKLVKTLFDDFKPVADGYVLPYSAVVYSDDEKTADVKITNVELNKGVDESLFDAATLGGGEMNMDLEKLMKQAEEMQKKYQR